MAVLSLIILSYCYLIKQNRVVLFLLFFLLTTGFQLIPSEYFEFQGLSKSYDYLIIFSLLFFLIEFNANYALIKRDKTAKLIISILLFLLFYFVYSYFIIGTPLVYILKGCRVYFLILLYFQLRKIPMHILEKFLDLLGFIIVFLCFLYILQPILHRPILYGSGMEVNVNLYNSSFGTIERYYNTPVLNLFYFFFYLYQLSERKKILNFVLFFIIALTIVLSFSRTIIITSIAISIILFYLKSSNKKSLGLYLLGAIILFSSTFLSDILFSAISSLKGLKFADLDYSGDNTFSYRIAHFIERFNFIINQSFLQTCFGYGFFTESSPITQNFQFIVGLINVDTGVKMQFETADIAWSILILQFGIIGTLLFIFLINRAILKIYSYKKSKYSIIFGCYFLLAILSSLTTIEILLPNYIIAVCFFGAIQIDT